MAKKLFTLEVIKYTLSAVGTESAVSKIPEGVAKKLYSVFDPVEITKMREWIK